MLGSRSGGGPSTAPVDGSEGREAGDDDRPDPLSLVPTPEQGQPEGQAGQAKHRNEPERRHRRAEGLGAGQGGSAAAIGWGRTRRRAVAPDGHRLAEVADPDEVA